MILFRFMPTVEFAGYTSQTDSTAKMNSQQNLSFISPFKIKHPKRKNDSAKKTHRTKCKKKYSKKNYNHIWKPSIKQTNKKIHQTLLKYTDFGNISENILDTSSPVFFFIYFNPVLYHKKCNKFFLNNHNISDIFLIFVLQVAANRMVRPIFRKF